MEIREIKTIKYSKEIYYKGIKVIIIKNESPNITYNYEIDIPTCAIDYVGLKELYDFIGDIINVTKI